MRALQAKTLSDESEKKEIPLRVFENHLRAIVSHLKSDDDFFNLKSNNYFNKGVQGNSSYDEEKLKRLLFNSWSTEFALINSSNNPDDDFKKFSLHWCFPQTYYSIYLSTTAYYLVKNISLGHNHKGLLKEFCEQIGRGWYPKSMSFWCTGEFNNYTYTNIGAYEPKNSLSYSEYDADSPNKQIAQFLKTTRDRLLKKRKNEKQAGRSAIMTKGKDPIPKTSYNKADWIALSSNQWNTTIIDLIYRLRIKSNYEQIESFIAADYNVSRIIKCLEEIVFRLNFVNECYIAKIIGFKKYAALVESFPTQIEDNQIQYRLNELILPNK